MTGPGGYRVAVDELWQASSNMLKSVDKLDQIRAAVRQTDLASADLGSLGVMDAVYAAYVNARDSHRQNLDQAEAVFTAAAEGLRAVADNYQHAEQLNRSNFD
jgi:hypothetical protein